MTVVIEGVDEADVAFEVTYSPLSYTLVPNTILEYVNAFKGETWNPGNLVQDMTRAIHQVIGAEWTRGRISIEGPFAASYFWGIGCAIQTVVLEAERQDADGG